MRYLQPDSELQSFTVQVIDMLQTDDNTVDAQALVCFLGYAAFLKLFKLKQPLIMLQRNVYICMMLYIVFCKKECLHGGLGSLQSP